MADRDQHGHVQPLRRRQPHVVVVQLREFPRYPLQARHDRRAGTAREHSVHCDEVLVRGVEARTVEIPVCVLLEKALYRSVGQPCEIAGYQKLYTVVGLQSDEPDAIELEQQLDALGLGYVVNLDDMLGRHVIERTDGNQE